MSMANREVPDAAEHETFPGPGPLRADEAKRGIRPVEQMVDAAIDRIAREREAARDEIEREGSEYALSLAATEGASTSLAAAAAAAAASASTGSARRANARLRWKGLDVSDEFRSYAERVARGEDLPPFKGKILAEPGAEFPWDPKAQRRAEGRALKRQFGLWSGVALFLGLSVWVLLVQVGKQTDAPRSAGPVTPPAVSTTVLSNQPALAPSVVAPNAEGVAAEPPPTVAQLQPEALDKATPEASTPTAAPTTALASLQERGKGTSAPVAASGTRAAASSAALSSAALSSAALSSAALSSAAVPSAGARPSAAAAPAVAPGTAAPAPAASSVGVFVATRAPSTVPTVPSESGDAARTPPSAAPASLGAVAAPAPAPSAAAPANPGGTDPATAAHADPKKEPGREASAMGPLLVETPSF